MRESFRLVGPGSFWSLVANLLGFASLIFDSAKPLQQFGISGAIAAVLAMICAYAIFPPFLRSAQASKQSGSKVSGALERFFTARHLIIGVTAVVIAAAFSPFAFRANTDPSLPSYFAGGDNIRGGLEAIDRSSGKQSAGSGGRRRRGRIAR